MSLLDRLKNTFLKNKKSAEYQAMINRQAIEKVLDKLRPDEQKITIDSIASKSPLMLAVLTDDRQRVKTLLTNGADGNQTDNSGQTAVMYAARRKNLATLDILLSSQTVCSGIDMLCDKGKTALMYAIEVGSVEAVRKLIAAGADFKLANPSGLTAIAFARQAGQDEVAAFIDSHIELIELDTTIDEDTPIDGLSF